MLSSCLTQVTDGEATRGLKMGIILLIKKKYRKQHAAVGDKTEEGEQKKKRIDGAGKQRVSVMTQFNLAAQHTFGFEVV